MVCTYPECDCILCQKEPDTMKTEDVPTLKHALAASDSLSQMIARVRAGDSDEAVVYIEHTIHALAAILSDYHIELAEVLPLVECSRCRLQVAEYRRSGEEKVCLACAREHVVRVLDPAPAPPLSRAGCLATALEAVTSRSYGAPVESFARVARMWSEILEHEVSPARVPMCLVALKLARLVADTINADSWADVAGYAACGAEVAGAGQ